MRRPLLLSVHSLPARNYGTAAALLALAAIGCWLLWAGLIHAPGPHDNDFTSLMWLVKHATWRDPSPLAIGHYGALQLLLSWWLRHVFGSALVAAKVLSTLGTLLSAWALYAMTRGDHGEIPALLVLLAFALSASALQTGQSEFADALSGGLLLAGLWQWWRTEERSGLLAGVLMGSAGLTRLHFVFFSFFCASLAALLGMAFPSADRTRRAAAGSGLALFAGALLGNLPGFLLNLRVHGTLGSPVASSLIGQVLYGMDELDLLSTYNLHPLGQILRDDPGAIWRLMSQRIRENPELWGVPLLALLAAALRGRRWSRAALRHVLLMSGLSLVYFLSFVTLCWWLSPRLLFPLVALNRWLMVVVPAQLLWGAFRFSRPLFVAVFVALLAQQWRTVAGGVRNIWRTTREYWSVSGQLVHVLRAHGMKDAREAFVYDWNRFVVDDPDFQPFYDFGFWNLLVPAYREERPIPMPYMEDLPALGRFFQEHGVKFFVVPRDENSVARFKSMVRLVKGEATLPGFHRESVLARDLLFVRDP
jgi:hypothetical protein